ncbi:CoA-binding protein [Shigella flexneri]
MKPDRAGYLMMRNLLAGGLSAVMPVTPAYKAVQGGAGWPGSATFGGFLPDLAVLCTHAKRNLELLESLARKAVKPVLSLPRLLNEQPELLACASRYQMRILRPNSLGLLRPGKG